MQPIPLSTTEERFFSSAVILSAAASGSVSKVKALIQSGSNINSQDYDLRTPLHLATSEGHSELVRYMVEEWKANLNVEDRWHRTPLADALSNQHTDIASYLVEHGGTLAYSPHESGRELLTAAYEGSILKCKILLELGTDVNVLDYNGRTAIHLAAMAGRTEIVVLLLRFHADVNTVDRFGSTPLQDAVKNKNFEIAGLIRIASTQEADLKIYNHSERFTSALYQTINLLCEKDSWQYGTGWVTNDEGKFVASEAWFTETKNVSILAAWRQSSEKCAILIDDENSIIAKAAKTGKAQWTQAQTISKESKSFQLDGSTNTMGSIRDLNGIASASFSSSSHIDKEKKVDSDSIDSRGNLREKADSESRINETLKSSTDRGTSAGSLNKSSVALKGTTSSPIVYPLSPNLSSVSQPCPGFQVEVPHLSQLENPESQFLTSFAVPITVNNVLITVLEFRSFFERQIDEETVSSIQSVAVRMLVGHLRHIDGSSSTLRGMFADQINEVYRTILASGIFTETLVRHEVEWYYSGLGLHEVYWRHFTPQQISQHVMALISSKLQSQSGASGIVRYRWEDEKRAIYIYPQDEAVEAERRIETKWLHEGYSGSKKLFDTSSWGVSVKQFLSEGSSAPETDQRIVISFVSVNEFVSSGGDANFEGKTDLWKISTCAFLREKAFESRKRYQGAVEAAIVPPSPVVNVEISGSKNETKACVVTVCYSVEYTHSFLSSMTVLLQKQGYSCNRKYVETFANGLICYSFHLPNASTSQLHDLAYQISATWILPRTTISSMVEKGQLELAGSQWAYCGWKFVYHFLSREPEEWSALWDGAKDVTMRSQLLKLKKRIHNDIVTERRIAETIAEYPEFIAEMYLDFREHFFPTHGSEKPPTPKFNQDLWSRIRKVVLSNVDLEILRALLNFNASILKTNFFKASKTALSFRLSPEFLRDCDYEIIPYGVFLVIGAEFRGFHIRFDDVARGGLRMIKSRNKQIWMRNAEGLFDENYNLALTQTLKNKDIPESGSKGTIFLNMDHQEKEVIAFRKYIDAILDLLQASPEVVDHFGKPEILFMGPDEGTAGYMDWAALHARRRGWKFWSSFTTGKSQELGGIPHDLYGMTTRGVHEYVLGILRKLNLNEEDLCKVQTGGPDGDLGSNEIKISRDKTIAVVDGSGVLYDPEGINRPELNRLAVGRLMVNNFDKSKLSKGGFLILVDDTNVVLPNGQVIENGLNFRNNFHLDPLCTADLFVPCGGRPGSVNMSNVDLLIGENKKPRFKYIVEGANLFFTQEARMKLSDAGVIIIKDASTNKGGVTSSSFEVLASLCMNDVEYEELMCVKCGVIPEFYQRYLQDTVNQIAAHAAAEFECLWNESQRPGSQPLCVITDHLSERINQLNYQIRDSGLWDDNKLVTKVLREVIPISLQEQLGLQKIISRLPKSYIDATLSSYLAASYVYSHGLMANEFAFYQFMQKYRP